MDPFVTDSLIVVFVMSKGKAFMSSGPRLIFCATNFFDVPNHGCSSGLRKCLCKGELSYTRSPSSFHCFITCYYAKPYRVSKKIINITWIKKDYYQCPLRKFSLNLVFASSKVSANPPSGLCFPQFKHQFTEFPCT